MDGEDSSAPIPVIFCPTPHQPGLYNFVNHGYSKISITDMKHHVLRNLLEGAVNMSTHIRNESFNNIRFIHGYHGVESGGVRIEKDDSIASEPNFTHVVGTEGYILIDMTFEFVNDDVLFLFVAVTKEDRGFGFFRPVDLGAGFPKDEDLVQR